MYPGSGSLSPDPKAESIEFKTTDGLTLRGSLHRQPERNPKGLILFCPETDGSHWSAMSYCHALVEDGFDILSFDFRGQGESDGAKSPDGQEKQDVLAAVGYMRSTGHLHVGVLAEEDAALAAIQAASLHEGIESLALVAPSASWGESLGQDGRFFDPHGLFGREQSGETGGDEPVRTRVGNGAAGRGSGPSFRAHSFFGGR